MLKLLLLLLVFEAPQDSRGSPPSPSSIRMSPSPRSSVSSTSDIRSGEKTTGAPWGSSSSTKLRVSRPREGVTKEEEGWGRVGESRVWGSREEEAAGAKEVEEDESPWRRAWSSSSYKQRNKCASCGFPPKTFPAPEGLTHPPHPTPLSSPVCGAAGSDWCSPASSVSPPSLELSAALSAFYGCNPPMPSRWFLCSTSSPWSHSDNNFRNNLKIIISGIIWQ